MNDTATEAERFVKNMDMKDGKIEQKLESLWYAHHSPKQIPIHMYASMPPNSLHSPATAGPIVAPKAYMHTKKREDEGGQEVGGDRLGGGMGGYGRT